MKSIDKVLLNAIRAEIEEEVKAAGFVEKLQTEGKSFEDVILKAKTRLKMKDSESVIAEHRDYLSDNNNLIFSLITVNGIKSKLDELNIDDRVDISLIKTKVVELEKDLSKVVSSLLNLDVSELYLKGE